MERIEFIAVQICTKSVLMGITHTISDCCRHPHTLTHPRLERTHLCDALQLQIWHIAGNSEYVRRIIIWSDLQAHRSTFYIATSSNFRQVRRTYVCLFATKSQVYLLSFQNIHDLFTNQRHMFLQRRCKLQSMPYAFQFRQRGSVLLLLQLGMYVCKRYSYFGGVNNSYLLFGHVYIAKPQQRLQLNKIRV